MHHALFKCFLPGALLLASLCAHAATDELSASFQARYDALKQSIDTKNLQAARGMFSTDYTQLRVDGAGRNLDQTIEQLAATGSGDSNLEVLSVTQEDTQATVSVRSHALMQPPALVSENRPLKLEVQRSDTWVKGESGWQLRRSVVDRIVTTWDGKPAVTTTRAGLTAN